MSFRIRCIIFVLISYLKISAILSDHETLADSNNRKIQHHPHHYSQTQNNHSAIINLADRCRHKLIRFQIISMKFVCYRSQINRNSAYSSCDCVFSLGVNEYEEGNIFSLNGWHLFIKIKTRDRNKSQQNFVEINFINFRENFL